jgi:hypothetical protein
VTLSADRLRLTGWGLAGTLLLRASFASEPGSRRFYALSLTTAATWLAGGAASRPPASRDERRVLAPVATGVAAFAAFYAAARVARRIPASDQAVASVLHYAHRGSDPLVLATTLLNGLGEEVFFRGAVYGVAGRHPVTVSTALYTASAAGTRNPALVLASAVMGALFGQQRRATGGIRAPVVTHLTWATLMLRFLPPLFGRTPAAVIARRQGVSRISATAAALSSSRMRSARS